MTQATPQGAGAMSGCIHAMYRYPVKGLSAEPLHRTVLTPGAAIPMDRRYALAHGAARNRDGDLSRWRPKGHFLQLMSHERLASLETRFDETGRTLTVLRHGRQVSHGSLTDSAGCAVLEQFFAQFMRGDVRGSPKIVECDAQPFSDVHAPFISLINLASVRDLARVVGREVDPMRFRANILLDGIPAWQEFRWLGRFLQIGGATVKIEERIGRCAATNVEPGTGRRDMALPRTMITAYGHDDCGVYASAVTGGAVSVGDPLRMSPASP